MPHIHDKIDFTVSAFILHPTDEKLLLLKHRKLGKWLQPGGHIELHENPWEALTHELLEETGLNLESCNVLLQNEQPQARGNTVLPLPFHLNQHDFSNTHQHIDLCYLLEATRADITDSPDGADAIAWLGRADIQTLHEKAELFDGTYDICNWIFDRYDSLR